MARAYSQNRSDKHISVICDNYPDTVCAGLIIKYGVSWRATKKGRTTKWLDGLELGFYYSDGKLAHTMWIERVPTPANEPKFAPAVGVIPGLTP
jgi:hypothetical protein